MVNLGHGERPGSAIVLFHVLKDQAASQDLLPHDAPVVGDVFEEGLVAGEEGLARKVVGSRPDALGLGVRWARDWRKNGKR